MQGPPDSIIAENVPPIPAELTEALERYANIRSASFQGWVGDDKDPGILITTRFGDSAQVHYVQKPMGDRQQLTFLRERVLYARPRPGHSEFLYSTDRGGAENYQFFLRPLERGDAIGLTNPKSRNLSPVWSKSGDLLAWSSNARNGKDIDVHIMATADPKSARILKEVNGDWSVADISPDGKKVAAVEFISANESYIHIIDIATGDVQTLTPKDENSEEKVSNSDPKFSHNGKSIYWITDKDSELRYVVRFDLSAGSVLTAAQFEGDIEEFLPFGPKIASPLADQAKELLNASSSPRTSLENLPKPEDFFLAAELSRLILVVNFDGNSYLMGGGSGFPKFPNMNPMNPLLAKERMANLLAAATGTPLTGLKYDSNREELGYTRGDSHASADAYSLTVDGAGEKHINQWTDSELGGLDPASFVKPELIKFKTFDDKEIPAFVYRPAKKNGKTPVMIDIHGGPEGQFRPAFMGRLNYLINELGITLICPNVRGSSGYGKTYLKLDNGMKREDSVKDIGALLDWIAQQDDMDAARVGVMGGSYGGYMVLACLTNFPDKIKAAIDVVGISNFVTFLQNTQGYRRDLRRAEYGDERDPKMREYLEKISPLTNAGKIKAPLLVAQGKNDPRVPITEAEQIVKAVRSNGVPVWYIVAKDEGHGFAKKKNQDYLQAAEVMFLKEYLLK